MKVVLGCDVDPVLPSAPARRHDPGVWRPLDEIPRLMDVLGDDLPRITWLIRSDASVRHFTGDYASGYLVREQMWERLSAAGHRLGWHMHLMSFSRPDRRFVFDPAPEWLSAAWDALGHHFPVRFTRTGWDYGSNHLFQELDGLGVELDFSALPGNRIWRRLGPSRFVVDWLLCSPGAYRPSRHDYQRPGADRLRLVELPITQFDNPLMGQIRRLAGRVRHGCLALRGLRQKTRLLTERWNRLPEACEDLWAFYFHPEDLAGEGVRRFAENVSRLRTEADAEFLTPDDALRLLAERRAR